MFEAMAALENTTCLIELQYLPCVQYFTKFIVFDAVKVEACEHYQKGSFRNRCHIAGPQGISRLSVPLMKGKHQQMPIRDVSISYVTPWFAQHWHAIRTAYGSAPYFMHYKDQVKEILYARKTSLFALNEAFLLMLTQAFQLTPHTCTQAYQAQTGDFDLRDAIHPKRPKPDPAFKPSEYLQVFASAYQFMPNLSALDLLFCAGPESRSVLLASSCHQDE